MDLDQKIDRFLGMNFKNWDANDKPYIKEIKMSNDGVYLFVCKKY